jgi:16S rRNA (cytidine1402-2'-O)-methyltransferase
MELIKPALYPVSVPIGNYDDITLRAINVLKNADLIIGEERSTTEKLLKKYDIHNKEIILLNEHNETNDAKSILLSIIQNNLSAALFSEAGTPCIADPGALLVNLCHEYHIPVVPIPGVSSIMTALMASGLVNDSFKFIGFLSVKKEIRLKELKSLNSEQQPIIFLETPYRMRPLLNDIEKVCGKNKNLIFAYKLTQPEEFIIKSNIVDIIQKTQNLRKGEFVIILLPNTTKNH